MKTITLHICYSMCSARTSSRRSHSIASWMIACRQSSTLIYAQKTIVDGTKRQENLLSDLTEYFLPGSEPRLFPFLFSRLQMPAEQHFLKRELRTEHPILVQLKQLHGFPN